MRLILFQGRCLTIFLRTASARRLHVLHGHRQTQDAQTVDLGGLNQNRKLPEPEHDQVPEIRPRHAAPEQPIAYQGGAQAKRRRAHRVLLAGDEEAG